MKRIWIPQVAVCAMLLWALNPANPYGYYILLRWVCCAVFAYLAVQSVKRKNEGWAWILGVTAAVYNPIVPVRLDRDTWSVVNLATIAIAAVSVVVLSGKRLGAIVGWVKNNKTIAAIRYAGFRSWLWMVLLRRMAAAGKPWAQFRLGDAYYKGQRLARNVQEAASAYRR